MIYNATKGVKGVFRPRKYNRFEGSKPQWGVPIVGSAHHLLTIEVPESEKLRKGAAYTALPTVAAVSILSFALLNPFDSRQGGEGQVNSGNTNQQTSSASTTNEITEKDNNSKPTVSNNESSSNTAGGRGGSEQTAQSGGSTDPMLTSSNALAPAESSGDSTLPVGGRGGGTTYGSTTTTTDTSSSSSGTSGSGGSTSPTPSQPATDPDCLCDSTTGLITDITEPLQSTVEDTTSTLGL